MRALVTGGAGFIGSHVADALVERGDDVVVLDNLSSGRRQNVNESARLVEADLRDAGAVEAAFGDAKPESCFHLAAQADVRVSISRPAFDAEVNLIGTINVLEAARAAGAQVVFSSTGGAIYGECDGPADEDSPRLPLAPYGASKLAGEEYLATWSRLYGEGHVALRFGNVYGPRQDPHGEAGVVAIFFGRIANGQELHIFGDGRQTRDYVYVGDVVAATLAAAPAPAGVYNIGTGVETSVLDLAEACKRASGVDAEVVFDPPRLGELSRSVLDPSARRAGARLHAFDLSRRRVRERPGISSGWRKERTARGRTSPPHGPSGRVRARPALAHRRDDRDRSCRHRALHSPPDRLLIGAKAFSSHTETATNAAINRAVPSAAPSSDKAKSHESGKPAKAEPPGPLPAAAPRWSILNGNGIAGAAAVTADRRTRSTTSSRPPATRRAPTSSARS